MIENEIIGIMQVKFSWIDRLGFIFISATTVAVFAYISNILLRRQAEKVEAIRNVSREFLCQLDAIDSLVKSYWSVARKDMEKGKEVMLSSSLYVSFPCLMGILDLLFKLKGKTSQVQKKNFEMSIEKVYEYATTNIDVEPRDASQETIMKASKEILQLKLKFQEFLLK